MRIRITGLVAVLAAAVVAIPAASSASSAHLCPRTHPHCRPLPHRITPVGTTPKPLPGCYGRLGIDVAGHQAYDCLYVPVNDGALYFGQTKFLWWYIWHPHAGDETVSELYFKPAGSRWPGAVPASNNPLVIPYGQPTPPRSNGRIIMLADGCLVDAPTDTDPPVPATCTPTQLGGAIAGATRPMTAIEQASVDGFWKVVGAAVPDAAW